MTPSEETLRELIAEIARVTRTVLSIHVDEFLEFVPEYKQRFHAHLTLGRSSSLDEWVSRGGRRSIMGQGATREGALADLVGELSGKKIAGYDDREKPLYEVGELNVHDYSA